jgi:hypothetical protein
VSHDAPIGRQEMEILKEGDHLEEIGIDGREIL